MAQPLEIVLVEDNPNDVKLTLRALQKNNLTNRIEVLRDGVEAVEFLFCEGPYKDRNPVEVPRLILLDLKLPRMDGIELLRRIKSDTRTRSIPVVVLTSSREDHDVSESYQLGANSYIVKPVDFEQFIQAVRQLGLYWLLLNEAPTKAGG